MRTELQKQSAVPMSVVLAELAERAGKEFPVAMRVTRPLKESARRVVSAISVPSGYIPKASPIQLAEGAQPLKIKLSKLFQLLSELEKTSSVVYTYGFLVKCAQGQVDPDLLLKQYMEAVEVKK